MVIAEELKQPVASGIFREALTSPNCKSVGLYTFNLCINK